MYLVINCGSSSIKIDVIPTEIFEQSSHSSVTRRKIRVERLGHKTRMYIFWFKKIFFHMQTTNRHCNVYSKN